MDNVPVTNNLFIFRVPRNPKSAFGLVVGSEVRIAVHQCGRNLAAHTNCVVCIFRITSENVAERFGISREKQDRMACESHAKYVSTAKLSQLVFRAVQINRSHLFVSELFTGQPKRSRTAGLTTRSLLCTRSSKTRTATSDL